MQLTWSSGVVQPGPVTYPKPEDIQVGSETLSVFTGSFELKTQFRVPANASLGATEIVGKVHYQACNNRQCFRPATADVRLPVVIQAR